jgi:hypothetical protein
MAIRRDILKVNIIDTDSRQVLLAKYLRDTGKISSQLMGSADAFYYSYALGIDRSISDSAVELAVSESILALSGQIHRILNFHRIGRGIILPNEFLAQCGLAFAASAPTVVPQQSVVTLPSVTQKVNSSAPELVKHISPAVIAEDYDDDDDDDDEVEQSNEVKVGIRIGGLNASQSVADFLNGTNGR